MTSILKQEYRNLADRVCIQCKTLEDFNKIKEIFNIKFDNVNAWEKNKDRTGVDISFHILGDDVVLHGNHGSVDKYYKENNYKVIDAQEIIKGEYRITDSGYNLMMAKHLIDLTKRVKKLEDENR